MVADISCCIELKLASFCLSRYWKSQLDNLFLVLFPSSAQRGHDDDVSSTSEDDGYPEDMDQDKHDDSTDDSDTDRSDADSEGDEFGHRDDSERDNPEEKKSGVYRLTCHVRLGHGSAQMQNQSYSTLFCFLI